ncbi:hypothetical protein Droror1_Dr00016805 [Drosera rotundifolia]
MEHNINRKKSPNENNETGNEPHLPASPLRGRRRGLESEPPRERGGDGEEEMERREKGERRRRIRRVGGIYKYEKQRESSRRRRRREIGCFPFTVSFFVTVTCYRIVRIWCPLYSSLFSSPTNKVGWCLSFQSTQ